MNKSPDRKQEGYRSRELTGPVPSGRASQEQENETTGHKTDVSNQNQPVGGRIMSWRQRWGKTSLGNKGLILATIVIAAANLCYVLVALFQLFEMRSGSNDTHALAIAAEKQADRTKDLVDQMRDQADRAKSMAEQAVVQAQAARISAQAAQSAAETAT